MVCWELLFCSRRKSKKYVSFKNCSTIKYCSSYDSRRLVNSYKSTKALEWKKKVPSSLSNTPNFGEIQKKKFSAHQESCNQISGLQATVVVGFHIEKSTNQMYTLLSFRFWNDGNYFIELLKLEVQMKDGVVKCFTNFEKNCPFILHSSKKCSEQIPPGVHIRTFSGVRLVCKVAESSVITEFAKNNTFIQELPEALDLQLEYTLIFKTWKNWKECFHFASQQSLFHNFNKSITDDTSNDLLTNPEKEESKRYNQESLEPDNETEVL